jgi:thiosulfate dehydrogenase [quinone] large subunit
MASRAATTDRTSLWRFEAGAWLFVRLVFGIAWIRARWEKLGEPGWTAAPQGQGDRGIPTGCYRKSRPSLTGTTNLVQDIFLPNATLHGPPVTYGELLVGIALIVGLLTRFAALAGLTMNLAFLWHRSQRPIGYDVSAGEGRSED